MSEKRLFPLIKNVQAFINNNHPELYPDSDEWLEYWREEKKRCIEGWWVEEVQGEWRYMPPTLYFMINHWSILVGGDDNTAGRKIGKPFLRDVEWIVHTDWHSCRGFSGFQYGEYTGNFLVKKWWQEHNEEVDDDGVLVKLTSAEKRKLDKIAHIKNPNGGYKKYMDSVEILKMSYTQSQGLPLYSNPNEDYGLLSARSNGKSISMGACAGHDVCFDGRRYFHSELDNWDTGAGEIFIGAPETKKMKNLLGYVKIGLSNLYGEYDKEGLYEPAPFSRKWSGSWNKDKGDIFHQYEKLVAGKKKIVASGTNLAYGTFTVANPDAAVSNRRTAIYLDEVGLAPNIEEIHGANVNVLAIFGNKMGSNWYSGTGGNIDRIEGTKKLFYNPKQNGFRAFPDIWENRGDIWRFIPAEYSLQDYKDENGNTLLDEAREALLSERKRLAKADSNLPLIQKKMYMPIKPSEMFISKNSNLFPVAKLQEQSIYAEDNYDDVSVGWLNYTGENRTGLKWYPNADPNKKPIKSLNVDAFLNTNGLIEIYEHPAENIPPPSWRNALYKVVYDPVRDDLGGSSFASILVWKGFSHESWEQGKKDLLVAKWIGRFDKTEEIHEIAIKLGMYFNAKIFAELDVPEFYKFCEKQGLMHMMQPCLPGLPNKYGYGLILGQAKNSTNREAELAIRNLLLEERPNEIQDDGTKTYNLNHLYFPRIIEELINYDRDGNFDDVSAFKLLALWLASEKGQPVMRNKKSGKGLAKQLNELIGL